MNDKPRRRWYQFSLKTLLALVIILAAASGWYGNRLRLIEQERGRLAGKWYVRWEKAAPPILSQQPSLDVRGEGVDLHVPQEGIGRIDFHMRDGSGISRGIYRLDGNTITVAQSDPNQPRPTSFEKMDGVSVWTGDRITRQGESVT